MTQQNENQALTYEQAAAELEKIVRKLEKGGVPLEQSLELYRRGVALSGYCEDQLNRAQLTVEQVGGEE